MIFPGFTEKQKETLKSLASQLSKEQLFWLGGYFTALAEQLKAGDGNKQKPEWKVLYASMSGNAEWVAEKAVEIFAGHNIHAEMINLKDYDPSNLTKENKALFIISTHGEGDPPYAGEKLYQYLHNNQTDLSHLQYALLALGDSSYLQFCKAGRDIDKRLQELGAKPLLERVDCDQDFEDRAMDWIRSILNG